MSCVTEESLGAAAVSSSGPLTSPPPPNPQCTNLLSQEPAVWASAVNPLRWVSGTVGEGGPM